MHNVNSMFYTGAEPWHGLGRKLEGVATAAQAIEAAGLGWGVVKEPLYLKDGRLVPAAYATIREDSKDVLGVVGEVYRPLQNREAFSFFDAVVGSKEAIYHTAGALGAGERVWILAKLPGQVRVVGDDVADKFLLLTNTHDGTSAVQVMFTPIRVVCQNTLNVAVGDGSRKQKIRHTAAMGLRVADVREGLGIIQERFRIFEEAAQAMTRVQVRGATWEAFLKSTGLLPKEASLIGPGRRELSGRALNIIEEVSGMFEHGKGNNLPGVKGTAWAAFNAVTEYVDHTRSSRGQGRDKLESRAASLLFGSGADLKQKAWDSALALLG